MLYSIKTVVSHINKVFDWSISFLTELLITSHVQALVTYAKVNNCSGLPIVKAKTMSKHKNRQHNVDIWHWNPAFWLSPFPDKDNICQSTRLVKDFKQSVNTVFNYTWHSKFYLDHWLSLVLSYSTSCQSVAPSVSFQYLVAKPDVPLN